jgi:hypothetical protein
MKDLCGGGLALEVGHCGWNYSGHLRNKACGLNRRKNQPILPKYLCV